MNVGRGYLNGPHALKDKVANDVLNEQGIKCKRKHFFKQHWKIRLS